MKNIHILSTDKPTLDGLKIYITNSEEIKEGDWFYDLEFNEIKKSYGLMNGCIVMANNSLDCCNPCFLKKIILTTDQDLDGVQAIDDEFLEWFVENPSCESVEIEGHIYKGQDETEYKIIIPKAKPKQVWKQIIETCGGKEAFMESAGLKPKQEIELVNGFLPTSVFDNKETIGDFIKRESKSGNESVGIVKGVKWQQERRYSEEEVYQLTLESLDLGMRIRQDQLNGYSEKSGKELHKEWFEQFKK
jgi:hypothetical protein